MSIKNRILQLLWAALGMSLAYGIEYVGQNLGIFSLPENVVVMIGVIIPVITKAIRNAVVK